MSLRSLFSFQKLWSSILLAQTLQIQDKQALLLEKLILYFPEENNQYLRFSLKAFEPEFFENSSLLLQASLSFLHKLMLIINFKLI